MGFESRAISAQVTKQIVTIFSKTCDKISFWYLYKWMFWVSIRIASARLLQKIPTI